MHEVGDFVADLRASSEKSFAAFDALIIHNLEVDIDVFILTFLGSSKKYLSN